eukprot:GHRR01026365.1.p1 GENE.GHRR01026365.1~~GHRR01026365.1.p1  ORF type:complete len:143 (+),score=31.43 GHRR01026365.1:713-1141(+)
MFFSNALQIVFKSTGGRIWTKRWGLPKLSRTRKENRKKDIKIYNQNMEILKAAGALQPQLPVRLWKPLPDWQVERMKLRLEQAQRLLNMIGGSMSFERAEGLMQHQLQRRRTQHQRMVLPPQDPQQLQHHYKQQRTQQQKRQ